jgi:CubicO group peptidase (beta-lactamase class C family)
LIREYIFEPLQLGSAGFGWPARDDPDQPWGHGFWQGSSELIPDPPGNSFKLSRLDAPAGDIHMSITDFAKCMQAYLGFLAGDTSFVNGDSFDHLFDTSMAYSGGWFHDSRSGDPVSYHSGSAGTFLTKVTILRKYNRALIICTNGTNEDCNRAVVSMENELIRLVKSMSQ